MLILLESATKIVLEFFEYCEGSLVFDRRTL